MKNVLKCFVAIGAAFLSENAFATSRHVSWGIELWTCTQGSNNGPAEWVAQLGSGGDVILLGIYGNAALDNPVVSADAYDREALFSVSGQDNTTDGHEVSGYALSHHGVDPAYYSAILKQTGRNNLTHTVNVTFPGGIKVPNGLVRLAMQTGAYDPNNGFNPVNYGTNTCMSYEAHLTFVFQ